MSNGNWRKVRAAGYPTNARGSGARVLTRPPEQDVTTLWQEAVGREEKGRSQATREFNFGPCQGLPLFGNNQNPIPRPGTQWAELDEAKALLVKYKDSMDKMHEAAHFPRNASKGLGMLLPERVPLRNGARMLALEAHVRSHEKDPHGGRIDPLALHVGEERGKRSDDKLFSASRLNPFNRCPGLLKDLLPPS